MKTEIKSMGFLIIGSLFAFLFLSTMAEASWVYRTNVTIEENLGQTLTDYQVQINSLNTTDLYLNGKLRSDCGDISVTNSTGDVIIHWVEKCVIDGSGDGNSTIWVKIPQLPASSTETITIYYGDLSISTNTSDSAKTMIAYDDFKDGVVNPYWSGAEGASATEMTGTCSGTERSCDTFTEETPCNSQNGCSWSNQCLGTITSCAEITEIVCGQGDEECCIAYGCGYSEPDCSGTISASCGDNYGYGNGCENVLSECSWGDYSCGGTTSTCDVFDGTDNTTCENQLDCSWNEQIAGYMQINAFNLMFWNHTNTSYTHDNTNGFRIEAEMSWNCGSGCDNTGPMMGLANDTTITTNMVQYFNRRTHAEDSYDRHEYQYPDSYTMGTTNIGTGENTVLNMVETLYENKTATFIHNESATPNQTYDYDQYITGNIFPAVMFAYSSYTGGYVRFYSYKAYKMVSSPPSYAMGEEEYNAPINISDCSVLNETEKTYYLTADITNSESSSCMNITANDVTLDCQGHTIDGKDTLNTYGIYSGQSGTIINNCTLTDWHKGAYFSSSNNCLVNNTATSSNTFGVYVGDSNSITIENHLSTTDGAEGIYLYSTDDSLISAANFNNDAWAITLFSSDNNIIKNNSFSSDSRGIVLTVSSNNNEIYDNKITSSSDYGIYFGDNGGTDNKIYNNKFSNTQNVYFAGSIGQNYWNTTRQAGTRIYSNGTEIGGNYWTNPAHEGGLAERYSELCWDEEGDGFCDNPLELATDNIDYLALSNKYGEPPYVSAVFNYSSVDFGLLEHNTENNPAPNQFDGAYNCTVYTNYGFTLLALGMDFDDGDGHTFDIENLIMDAEDDPIYLDTETAPYLTDYAQEIGSWDRALTIYHGFWLSIPAAQYASNYTSTVTITVEIKDPYG
jgi:parallel beta-helix repeat protein